MMTAHSVDEAHEARRAYARRAGWHMILWAFAAAGLGALWGLGAFPGSWHAPLIGAVGFCASRAGMWLGKYWGWVEGFADGQRWRVRNPRGISW